MMKDEKRHLPFWTVRPWLEWTLDIFKEKRDWSKALFVLEVGAIKIITVTKFNSSINLVIYYSSHLFI